MRLVCLFILSLTLSFHSAPADTTISNFSKVNDALYRGGRREPGELANAIAAEMNVSESLGLRFFSKPLDAIDPVSDEDDARIDEILAIMGNPAAQPVFVHC